MSTVIPNVAMKFDSVVEIQPGQTVKVSTQARVPMRLMRLIVGRWVKDCTIDQIMSGVNCMLDPGTEPLKCEDFHQGRSVSWGHVGMGFMIEFTVTNHGAGPVKFGAEITGPLIR